MTLLGYILGGLVGILTLGQIILEHHLKGLPENQRKKRRTLRTWLLWITLVLFGANQLVVGVNSGRKDSQILTLNTNLTEARRTFESEMAALKANFEARSAVINSNQLDLMQRNKELVSALVTNSSIDAGTRAKILAADKQFQTINADVVDLNAWREDWTRRQTIDALQAKEAAAKADRELWQACIPVHDYAVRRLEWILAELAKQRNEKLESSFQGIPTAVTSGQIAELRLGTNEQWHFKISIGAMPHPHLHVVQKAGGKSFDVAANSSEVIVGGFRGNNSNYRETINVALRDFCASLASSAQTNR